MNYFNESESEDKMPKSPEPIALQDSTRLSGEETLYGTDLEMHDMTIIDFWRWAFGNLLNNDIRGIFAEWLVARILEIPLTVRQSWHGWDLETPEGVKIEVKASAYVQEWPTKQPSKIVFTGLKGREWDPDNGYTEFGSYKADLYIFCVEIEKNPAKWDALDLSQWHFYILTREQIERRGSKTLTLGALAEVSKEMTARELRAAVAKLIEEMKCSKISSNGISSENLYR